MLATEAAALQMTGSAHGFTPSGRTAPVAVADVPGLRALDHACSGLDRTAEINSWLENPEIIALTSHSPEGVVAGFAIAHAREDGHWLGPVSAEDGEIAGDLVRDLSAALAGQTIHMQVPETNQVALLLATELALSDSGQPTPILTQTLPDLPWEKIFALLPPDLATDSPRS